MLLRELADLKPGTMIRGLTIGPSFLGRVASFSVDGWEIQDDCIHTVHVASLELTDADKQYFVHTAEQLRNELFRSHPYDQDLIKKHSFPENVPVTNITNFGRGENVGMYLGDYYLAYDSDYDNEWVIGVKLLLLNGTVAYLRGTVDQDDKDVYNDYDGMISATSLKPFGDRQFFLC